jgi:hypothetical protein
MSTATMNNALVNEVTELEKIEKNLVERTVKLKQIAMGLFQNPQPPITIPITKNWGPGRAIPDNIRKMIGDDIQAKKLSGREIAAKYKVSLPSVYKIREELGIVKHRSMFG